MTELLAARDVTFGYAGEPVLERVTITVEAGEFVALVGPNGSGKSTLLKVALGLLRPTSGRVELFGVEPARFGERWRMGYVPQRPALAQGLPCTVEELVATGRLAARRWWRRPRVADRDAVGHALEAVGLDELAHRRVRELSGGQQQRAFIARALAADPELLVLDEPVAGVDASSQRDFRDAVVHQVRDHGGSVLLVSHELSAVAADLDRVVVLKRTVRYSGPPSGLAAAGVSLGIHEADLPAWLEELR